VTTSASDAPTRIPPSRQVAGLLALVAVFVAAGLGLQALRAGAAPPASAAAASADPTDALTTPTPGPTPWVIPDVARTTVHRSGTPASGLFTTTTLGLEPALAAETTNPYTLRVETTANVEADAAARFVQQVLDDPRGWAGFGRNTSRWGADAGPARLVSTIASPDTTDARCGRRAATDGLWSCRVGGQVVLNSDRWHFMVPGYNNLDEYRAYLVNHHVGEFLGQRLAFCTEKGRPAPVMAQQDRTLDGCLPNAWPKLT